MEMDCHFISIHGKFVTSKTASFSRANISSRRGCNKSRDSLFHNKSINMKLGDSTIQVSIPELSQLFGNLRVRTWPSNGIHGNFHPLFFIDITT